MEGIIAGFLLAFVIAAVVGTVVNFFDWCVSFRWWLGHWEWLTCEEITSKKRTLWWIQQARNNH